MQARQKTEAIVNEVKKVVIGKDDCIRKILCAILAKGHILLTDIPGVGKTTMALAFSSAMSLKQGRVQFTPDVLPADIVGFSMYDKDLGKFTYHQGAVMCNMFLADEINRTSPKTQSALLEVMEEGKVTVDGVSRPVPNPFVVIATQNPMGSAGTQKLPDSQLDRFMVGLSMGYPDYDEEMEILKSRRGSNPMKLVKNVASQEDILAIREEIEDIYIADAIYEYMVELIQETRKHPMLQWGASPRASLALTRMASAYAYVGGRNYVLPEDVAAVYPDVITHRLQLNSRGRINGVTESEIVEQIMKQVEKPQIVGYRGKK